MPNIFVSSEETMDGNTTRGSLPVLFVVFVLLTAAELMSVASRSERRVLFKDSNGTCSMSTSHSAKCTFSWNLSSRLLIRSTPQEIPKAGQRISIDWCPLVDDYDNNNLPDILNLNLSAKYLYIIYTIYL